MTVRRTLIGAIAFAAMFVGTAGHAATLTVYQSPSCGCCAKWFEHVEAHGFTVNTIHTDDMMAVKKQLGIPDKAMSCHTTKVANYVVEGHVPAADIKRLLTRKPKARGIAVAGMPMGSPGMDMGGQQQPYATMLIGPDGKMTVFARH